MNTESARIKIRKLLALGADGTNEHVSRLALEKAYAMMQEYGITEVGEDPDHIEIRDSDWFVHGLKQNWHKSLGGHISRLYGCKHIFSIGQTKGSHRFFGMSHQIEAAEETFLFVVKQVEEMYRIALRAFDGQLDKYQRAELRASFKDAAVARVGVRISKILNERQPQGTALVIVDTVAQAFEGFMEENGIKKREVAIRSGFGSGAGFNAGGLIQIQKEVEEKTA